MITENWFLLVDPAWSGDGEPPLSAVVGLWPVEDGAVGRFRANPDYAPSDPASPTDPVDALLRLALRGAADAEQIQLVLRDALFDVAMNGDGRPLVVRSPDDKPCVVVATAEPHRRRVRSPQWRRADVEELVGLLADGVDVLFNPDGPASVRLLGSFIRSTTLLTDEDADAARARLRDTGSVRVLPWTAGAQGR